MNALYCNDCGETLAIGHICKPGVLGTHTNPIPDTTNTDLREMVADTLRLGHYGIAETNVTNKMLELINTEVHKVLERLEVPTINDVFPDKPYDGTNTYNDMMKVVTYYKDLIEKEKNRYV